ncbi:hypothetical protein [Fluviicola taffensis]|uniref:hypothetical protein n=1 Tax=Fluviicola taffensis TaxID=191579 RepID=UPI0031380875
MRIQNKGIRTDAFYIPPFDLKEGEIVVIYLSNGPHFFQTEMFLKDIFSGSKKNENVEVYEKLTFVEHFIEPKFRRLFRPVTVGEYLKKNADLESPFATRIYENKWIHKKRKVNELAGTPRKLVSLYATLSKTSDIIFDLTGVDPKGAEEVFGIVREVVRKGGSAILLDSFEDMKNECDKYIELQWLIE